MLVFSKVDEDQYTGRNETKSYRLVQLSRWQHGSGLWQLVIFPLFRIITFTIVSMAQYFCNRFDFVLTSISVTITITLLYFRYRFRYRYYIKIHIHSTK